MSADTDYDNFSCCVDLLGYQKNEITDSVCKLVNVQSPLLVEGIFLCTFALPANNHDFKMFYKNCQSRCMNDIYTYSCLHTKYFTGRFNQGVLKKENTYVRVFFYFRLTVLMIPLFPAPTELPGVWP